MDVFAFAVSIAARCSNRSPHILACAAPLAYHINSPLASLLAIAAAQPWSLAMDAVPARRRSSLLVIAGRARHRSCSPLAFNSPDSKIVPDSTEVAPESEMVPDSIEVVPSRVF